MAGHTKELGEGRAGWPELVARATVFFSGWAMMTVQLSAGRLISRHLGHSLYTWTAVIGVMLTGFVLMERLGMRGVALLAGGLPAAALCVIVVKKLFSLRARRKRAVFAVVVWLALWTVLTAASGGWPPLASIGEWLGLRDGDDPFVLYRAESAYYHIEVKQDAYNPTVRHMYLDKLKHSMTNVQEQQALQCFYERIYAAALNRTFGDETPVRALALGGGGYTFSRHLILTRPGSHVETVEIDPAVTRAARAAMNFTDENGIAVVHADAGRRVKNWAAQASETSDQPLFDCVFGDAITDFSVLYHLVTLEFFQKVRRILRPGGVFMMTAIDVRDSGRFIGALANTCAEVFEDVQVFATHDDGSSWDTFVVICSARPWRSGDDFPGVRIDEAHRTEWRRRTGGMILTDEFAPVENLLAPVVRASRIGEEEILFKTALRLHERRRYEESLAACRATLAAGADHYAARDLLALNLAMLGRVAEAATEWDDAIALWPNIPSLRNNLGYAYFQLGDLPAAIGQWEAAVRLDPDYTSARLNLEVEREGQRLLIPE